MAQTSVLRARVTLVKALDREMEALKKRREELLEKILPQDDPQDTSDDVIAQPVEKKKPRMIVEWCGDLEGTVNRVEDPGDIHEPKGEPQITKWDYGAVALDLAHRLLRAAFSCEESNYAGSGAFVTSVTFYFPENER